MTPRLTNVYKDVVCLSMGEKRDLYGILKNILEDDQRKINTESYNGKLVATMESVIGCPLSYTDRHFPHTTARQIIAWQAMNDGLSTNVAARFLKKNHTSVIWMRNKIDDIIKYPFCYDKEIELVNKFREAWKNGVQ